LVDPCQKSQQRRLAGTVRTDDSETITPQDSQIEVANNRPFTVTASGVLGDDNQLA